MLNLCSSWKKSCSKLKSSFRVSFWQFLLSELLKYVLVAKTLVTGKRNIIHIFYNEDLCITFGSLSGSEIGGFFETFFEKKPPQFSMTIYPLKITSLIKFYFSSTVNSTFGISNRCLEYHLGRWRTRHQFSDC